MPICDTDGIEIGALVATGVGSPELRAGARASLVDLAALVAELLRHRWGGSDVPGVALVTGDGALAGATPALERLLGWSSADRVGTSVFDLIHSTTCTTRPVPAPGPCRPRGEAPLDLRLVDADGGWCPVEITAENQLDDPAAGVITISSATCPTGAGATSGWRPRCACSACWPGGRPPRAVRRPGRRGGGRRPR